MSGGEDSSAMLPLEDPGRWATAREPAFTAEESQVAREWVERVRREGEPALRESARRFDGRRGGEALVLERPELLAALERVSPDERALLERTAERIRRFASAQRAALEDLEVPIDGGRAGQRWIPVERAGCYAPGGRHPLISSVLMTVVPARVAGVHDVTVACPARSDRIAAAAALAGADRLLLAGGAAAIAALAHGVAVPRADLVVGPGNAYVTAAKHAVSAQVGIDLLAGATELLVVADESANAATVAADLLAQAEHDPRALPWLLVTDSRIRERVLRELELQLADLPTAAVARQALARGRSAVVADVDELWRLCDALAPEHLALHVAAPQDHAARLHHFGALFLGEHSAEVLADYGAGPNHTLPTGGSARSTAGLSVLHFLRPTTWLSVEESSDTLCADAAALARLEGLEAHARAADRRRLRPTPRGG